MGGGLSSCTRISIRSQHDVFRYIDTKKFNGSRRDKKSIINLIEFTIESKWFITSAKICQRFSIWNYDKSLSEDKMISLCNGLLLLLNKTNHDNNITHEIITIMVNCLIAFSIKLPPEQINIWSVTNPYDQVIMNFITRYTPIKFIITEQFTPYIGFTSDNFKYYVFSSDQVMGLCYGNADNSYPITHHFLTNKCDPQALFNLINKMLYSDNDQICARTLLCLNQKYNFLDPVNEETLLIRQAIIHKISAMCVCNNSWLIVLNYLIPMINDDEFFHNCRIEFPHKNSYTHMTSYNAYGERQSTLYSIRVGNGQHSYLLPDIEIQQCVQGLADLLWEKYKSLTFHNDCTILQMCKIYQLNNCQQSPKCFNDLELTSSTLYNPSQSIEDIYKTLQNHFLPFWHKDFIIANLTTGIMLTILRDIRNNVVDFPKSIMDSLLDHHCIPDQLFMLAKLVRRQELTGKPIEFDEDIVISI